jgi:hypothetical protein
MKAPVRNHPKLRFWRVSSWPPAFSSSYGSTTIFPVGEQGVLKSVSRLPASSALPAHLELTIEFSGWTFTGPLCIDDTALLPQLETFLAAHLGQELSAIGGEELDL